MSTKTATRLASTTFLLLAILAGVLFGRILNGSNAAHADELTPPQPVPTSQACHATLCAGNLSGTTITGSIGTTTNR